MARKTPNKKIINLILWLGLAATIYFFYTPLKFQLLRILQLSPILWNTYLRISYEITAKTLLGLFLTSFFGALFFISIPVELVFLFYLSLNFKPWEVFFYVILGNLLGMIFNYFFGFLLGPRIMKRWLKKKYNSYQKKMVLTGPFVLVFGNIIPFPIELITVFIGALRYPFLRFLFYTFIGKVLKFFMLFFGYKYFSETLSYYWETYLWPWLKYLYNSYLAPLRGVLR